MDSTEPLDHSSNQQWIVTSTWILVGLSFIFLASRFYCRVAYNKSLWWDDWLLSLSWLLLLASSIAETQSIALGFGRHIYDVDPPSNIPEIGRIGQVSMTFSILSAVWSKTSFALTLLRLGHTMPAFKAVVWFIIITINLFMGLGIIFNFVQCIPLQRVWDPDVPGSCWPPEVAPKYGAFAAAYSGVADIALALLPWFLLAKLQMRMREKIGTAVAMSCGVFAGATALVKTPHVLAMGNKDIIFDSAPLVVWGHAETATTIVAASIPVLRVFVKNATRHLSERRHSRPLKGSSSHKTAAEAPGGNNNNNNNNNSSSSGRAHTTTSFKNPVTGSRAAASHLKLDSASHDSDRFRGGDDESDCGILAPSPSILRTQEFAIQVDHVDAAERARVEHSYEMDLYGIK